MKTILLLVSVSLWMLPSYGAFYYKHKTWEKETIYYYFMRKERNENKMSQVKSSIDFLNKSIGKKLFVETKEYKKSDIRIRFRKKGTLGSDSGGWSKIGAEALNIEKDQPTMTLAYDNNTDKVSTDTVLHEMMHALGIEHEHQSPQATNYVSFLRSDFYLENPRRSENLNLLNVDSNDRDVDRYITNQAILDTNNAVYSLYDPFSIMNYYTREESRNLRWGKIIGIARKLPEQAVYLSQMDLAILKYLYNPNYKKKHTKTLGLSINEREIKNTFSNSDQAKLDLKFTERGLIINLWFAAGNFLNTKLELHPILIKNSEIKINGKPVKLSNYSDRNELFDRLKTGKNKIELRLRKQIPPYAMNLTLTVKELELKPVSNKLVEHADIYLNTEKLRHHLNTIYYKESSETLDEYLGWEFDAEFGFEESYSDEIFTEKEYYDLTNGKSFEEVSTVLEQEVVTLLNYSKESFSLANKLADKSFSDGAFVFLIDEHLSSGGMKRKVSFPKLLEIFEDFIEGSKIIKIISKINRKLYTESEQTMMNGLVHAINGDFNGLKKTIAILKNQNAKVPAAFLHIIHDYYHQLNPGWDFSYDIYKLVKNPNKIKRSKKFMFLGIGLAREIENLHRSKCKSDTKCSYKLITENLKTHLSQLLKKSAVDVSTEEELNDLLTGLLSHSTWAISKHITEALLKIFPSYNRDSLLRHQLLNTSTLISLETYKAYPKLLKEPGNDWYEYAYRAKLLIPNKSQKTSFKWVNDSNARTAARKSLGISKSSHSFMSWVLWREGKYIEANNEHIPFFEEITNTFDNMEELYSRMLSKPCNKAIAGDFKYNYQWMASEQFIALAPVLEAYDEKTMYPVNEKCKPNLEKTTQAYLYEKLKGVLNGKQ